VSERDSVSPPQSSITGEDVQVRKPGKCGGTEKKTEESCSEDEKRAHWGQAEVERLELGPNVV
jgi:hypothetical protein